LALKNRISNFIKTVEDALSDEIESVEAKNENYVSIIVNSASLLNVARTLKDRLGFTIPVAGGGVDYLDENKMQMIYYLSNPKSRFILTLRVNLLRETPRLPTLTRIWEGMSFHEREALEMFGIEFEDHQNLVPLLLPPSWRGGYPLRKDFKGEGVN
jgi:NADH:ubiquinone oxidoreductase subunit C